MNLADLYATPQRKGGNLNLADAIHAMVPAHQTLRSADRDREVAAEQFDESMALEADRLATQREANAIAADQAETGNIINLAGLGLAGANTASKLSGLLTASEAAPAVAETAPVLAEAIPAAAAGTAGATGVATAANVGTEAVALNTAAAQSMGQSVAGTAGATAPAMGVGATVAKAVPYLYFAYVGYNILSNWFDDKEPSSLGSQNILEASEKGFLADDGRGNRVDLVDGRYLHDPYLSESSGKPYYHDLSDQSVLENARTGYARELEWKNFGWQSDTHRSEREDLQLARTPIGRDAASDSKMVQQGQLASLQRDKKTFSPSGLSSGAIRNTVNSFKTKYEEIINAAGDGGLG